MDHVEHCSLLAAEIERFALAIDGLPLDLPVPSCPGWAVSDLTLHLGKVHRWAENLVRLRAPERIPGPRGDLEPTASWVRDGGTALVATLRAADPDAGMWAWGVDQHVRWWSRRQLHETLVHRMDADLAAGAAPRADAAVAADAIDEFLVNLGAAAYFSPKVKELKGDGARIRFRATDAGAHWSVLLQPDGFTVSSPGDDSPHAHNAATLTGPAVTLLLVLCRRLPLPGSGLEQAGDPALVDFWLANSALE